MKPASAERAAIEVEAGPAAGGSDEQDQMSRNGEQVKSMKQIVSAAILMLASSSVWASEWQLDRRVDALSDVKSVTAFTPGEGGDASPPILAVRCKGKEFEIFVLFRRFLGDGLIPVVNRVDRNWPRKEDWYAPKPGTGLFVFESVALARNLVKGSSFVIEATDFRGVAHRATFSLVEAEPKITTVLKECGVE